MNTSYITQIQELEQTVQANKVELAKLEERQKTLQEEKAKITTSLQDLGIPEAELEKKIATLNAELEEAIKTCQEGLK